MYTPGKLRHQKKSFSPPSEFRQDETEKSRMFVTLNGGKGRSKEKGKRVLEILSDDEDSDGGLVFKRRRAARVPTPPATSPQGGNSLRDNPPSASSPIPTMVQGERGDGADSAPTPTLAGTSVAPATSVAAPDVISMPPPIMHFLRGFNGEPMPENPDKREGMPFYMGAFLAVALDWRTQARNAALQTHKLQTLEAKVSALEQENENLRRQDEASQASLKLAETAKEETEKQLAEAADLQADFYTQEVALQVQVTGLQGMIEAYEEVQEDLKSRCCEQADKLEKSEEEMTAKTKAMGLLQADHDKLKVEVSRLRVEKEALEKQVASGDAVIEELERDKKALIDDMAGTFEEGFQEALAQAACVNPGIDVSSCDSTHHIVDGKAVPLDLDD